MSAKAAGPRSTQQEDRLLSWVLRPDMTVCAGRPRRFKRVGPLTRPAAEALAKTLRLDADPTRSNCSA